MRAVRAISKTSFDKTDTSLGRINTLSISPSYAIASLKSRIISSKKIGTDHDVGSFQEENGETIPVLSDIYPGVNQDKPIAIV